MTAIEAALSIRAPTCPLPPSSCDAHVHVFDLPSVRPPIAQRNYDPDPRFGTAALDAFVASVGAERAVLVQPSIYGEDNGAMLAALERSPERLRGVAVVRSTIPPEDLHAMHRLGVRGIRVNLVQPGGAGIDDARALAPTLDMLGWHVQVIAPRAVLLAHAAALDALCVPIVVDHFGLPEPNAGARDASLTRLAARVADGRWWIKLSGVYRFVADATAVESTVRALIDANPNRLLWASDWPHVDVSGEIPTAAEWVDTLDAWLPDEPTRRAVFADNAAALYGFDVDARAGEKRCM